MTELTTACECGADIWCHVCVACEGHCWSTRGDEACQEIRKLRTRVKKLDEIETYWGDDLIEAHALFEESNAVCACGCPNEDHENYGEDGMSCGADSRECVPTSAAVLSMLEELRRQLMDEQVASFIHTPEQIEASQATIKRHEATMRKVHGMMKRQRELNAEQMNETIEPSPEEEILRASLEKL